MKKSFLKWAGLVFLAVCVASCEKQSEMSLENIKAPGSSVSVSGYVEIQEEWEWDTYAVLKDPVAAENISVILEIPNSSFSSGSKGNQVFTTTTDEYGMYNFDVKINPTSSVSAKIIIPQFEKIQGTYYENTTDKDTKKQGTLVFEVVTRNISLSSNQDYLVSKISLSPTVPQL